MITAEIDLHKEVIIYINLREVSKANYTDLYNKVVTADLDPHKVDKPSSNRRSEQMLTDVIVPGNRLHLNVHDSVHLFTHSCT